MSVAVRAFLKSSLAWLALGVTLGVAMAALARAAESLLAGGTPHRLPRSLRVKASRVRVVAEPREPVQIDGDAYEADWLEAAVQPGAITILRP